MRRIIFLDSGPLGVACGTSDKEVLRNLRAWLVNEATDGSAVVIPEITDYEIRRELLAAGLTASLARLDELHDFPGVYLPITTESIRLAADLWAGARRGGWSTADEKSIDADAILAAQVLNYRSDADDWWVATDNERHLSRHLGDRARPWQKIPSSREVREILETQQRLNPPT